MNSRESKGTPSLVNEIEALKKQIETPPAPEVKGEPNLFVEHNKNLIITAYELNKKIRQFNKKHSQQRPIPEFIIQLNPKIEILENISQCLSKISQAIEAKREQIKQVFPSTTPKEMSEHLKGLEKLEERLLSQTRSLDIKGEDFKKEILTINFMASNAIKQLAQQNKLIKEISSLGNPSIYNLPSSNKLTVEDIDKNSFHPFLDEIKIKITIMISGVDNLFPENTFAKINQSLKAELKEIDLGIKEQIRQAQEKRATLQETLAELKKINKELKELYQAPNQETQIQIDSLTKKAKELEKNIKGFFTPDEKQFFQSDLDNATSVLKEIRSNQQPQSISIPSQTAQPAIVDKPVIKADKKEGPNEQLLEKKYEKPTNNSSTDENQETPKKGEMSNPSTRDELVKESQKLNKMTKNVNNEAADLTGSLKPVIEINKSNAILSNFIAFEENTINRINRLNEQIRQFNNTAYHLKQKPVPQFKSKFDAEKIETLETISEYENKIITAAEKQKKQLNKLHPNISDGERKKYLDPLEEQITRLKEAIRICNKDEKRFDEIIEKIDQAMSTTDERLTKQDQLIIKLEMFNELNIYQLVKEQYKLTAETINLTFNSTFTKDIDSINKNIDQLFPSNNFQQTNQKLKEKSHKIKATIITQFKQVQEKISNLNKKLEELNTINKNLQKPNQTQMDIDKLKERANAIQKSIESLIPSHQDTDENDFFRTSLGKIKSTVENITRFTLPPLSIKQKTTIEKPTPAAIEADKEEPAETTSQRTLLETEIKSAEEEFKRIIAEPLGSNSENITTFLEKLKTLEQEADKLTNTLPAIGEQLKGKIDFYLKEIQYLDAFIELNKNFDDLIEKLNKSGPEQLAALQPTIETLRKELDDLIENYRTFIKNNGASKSDLLLKHVETLTQKHDITWLYSIVGKVEDHFKSSTIFKNNNPHEMINTLAHLIINPKNKKMKSDILRNLSQTLIEAHHKKPEEINAFLRDRGLVDPNPDGNNLQILTDVICNNIPRLAQSETIDNSSNQKSINSTTNENQKIPKDEKKEATPPLPDHTLLQQIKTNFKIEIDKMIGDISSAAIGASSVEDYINQLQTYHKSVLETYHSLSTSLTDDERSQFQTFETEEHKRLHSALFNTVTEHCKNQLKDLSKEILNINFNIPSDFLTQSKDIELYDFSSNALQEKMIQIRNNLTYLEKNHGEIYSQLTNELKDFGDKSKEKFQLLSLLQEAILKVDQKLKTIIPNFHSILDRNDHERNIIINSLAKLITNPDGETRPKLHNSEELAEILHEAYTSSDDSNDIENTLKSKLEITSSTANEDSHIKNLAQVIAKHCHALATAQTPPNADALIKQTLSELDKIITAISPAAIGTSSVEDYIKQLHQQCSAIIAKLKDHLTKDEFNTLQDKEFNRLNTSAHQAIIEYHKNQIIDLNKTIANIEFNIPDNFLTASIKELEHYYSRDLTTKVDKIFMDDKYISKNYLNEHSSMQNITNAFIEISDKKTELLTYLKNTISAVDQKLREKHPTDYTSILNHDNASKLINAVARLTANTIPSDLNPEPLVNILVKAYEQSNISEYLQQNLKFSLALTSTDQADLDILAEIIDQHNQSLTQSPSDETRLAESISNASIELQQKADALINMIDSNELNKNYQNESLFDYSRGFIDKFEIEAKKISDTHITSLSEKLQNAFKTQFESLQEHMEFKITTAYLFQVLPLIAQEINKATFQIKPDSLPLAPDFDTDLDLINYLPNNLKEAILFLKKSLEILPSDFNEQIKPLVKEFSQSFETKTQLLQYISEQTSLVDQQLSTESKGNYQPILGDPDTGLIVSILAELITDDYEKIAIAPLSKILHQVYQNTTKELISKELHATLKPKSDLHFKHIETLTNLIWARRTKDLGEQKDSSSEGDITIAFDNEHTLQFSHRDLTGRLRSSTDLSDEEITQATKGDDDYALLIESTPSPKSPKPAVSLDLDPETEDKKYNTADRQFAGIAMFNEFVQVCNEHAKTHPGYNPNPVMQLKGKWHIDTLQQVITCCLATNRPFRFGDIEIDIGEGKALIQFKNSTLAETRDHISKNKDVEKLQDVINLPTPTRIDSVQKTLEQLNASPTYKEQIKDLSINYDDFSQVIPPRSSVLTARGRAPIPANHSSSTGAKDNAGDDTMPRVPPILR